MRGGNVKVESVKKRRRSARLWGSGPSECYFIYSLVNARRTLCLGILSPNHKDLLWSSILYGANVKIRSDNSNSSARLRESRFAEDSEIVNGFTGVWHILELILHQRVHLCNSHGYPAWSWQNVVLRPNTNELTFSIALWEVRWSLSLQETGTLAFNISLVLCGQWNGRDIHN